MSSTQREGDEGKRPQVPDVTDLEAEADDHSDVDDVTQTNNDNGAPVASSSKKKKKKNKKGKNVPQPVVDLVLDKVKADGNIDPSEVDEATVREVLDQLKIMDVIQGKAGPSGQNKKDMGTHKFWATQPVPQLDEGPPEGDGYIEPSRPVEEVRQEPYSLPKEFEWSVLDITDATQNKEVHDLLSMNYVEDDNASFRFQYSREFLAWALTPPGFHKEWHIGVRVSSNKKLVAFISGVPITLRVRQHVIHCSEINYLCVHKKLRSKRLAPVLIKEVTRQCHLKGIFQAIYTAGIVIPTPVSTCRYHHRLINIPKLIETKFCFVPRNSTYARMIRLNAVADRTSTPGLREMERRDIGQVAELFTKYMKRFDMAPICTVDEIRHQLLSGVGRGEPGSGGPGRREGQVTWSYVVQDPNSGKITDFFSFYSLPSTVINSAPHTVLEAAYLFYYATDVGLKNIEEQTPELNARLTSLIGDAVVVSHQAKFDVFNALTLMDNAPILQPLKFSDGDGFLNFYLYNWRTAPLSGMESQAGVPRGKGVGVVML